MPDVIRSTESLCPVCLKPASARLLADGDEVVLAGSCDDHGDWQTVVWSGPPSFASWCGQEAAPAARQTCTAVLEVTRDCDLGCPVCFAESPDGAGPSDPTVAEVAARLSDLFAAEGEVNLQLSGGEPTTRDDLPEIVAAASSAGFTFVQLNTNGLRLASEDGYAEALRRAGLSSVFLQFDGVSNDTYQALRGRPLLAQKLRAVERCAEAGLAVVLVPTVVPGINDGELGALVRFAASWPGVVRGLHLQPMSYFGRYPREGFPGAPAAGRPRLTLPELLKALEDQTGGEVRTEHFSPSCCEHVRCSFRARYWVREGGVLESVRSAPSCCGSEAGAAPASAPAPASCNAPGPGTVLSPSDAPRRAVAATARQWSRRERESGACDGASCCGTSGDRPSPDAAAGPEAAGACGGAQDDLSRFLADADRILAISGMLFQDAWSIDMERIGRCCVQVVTAADARAPEGLVPFCLWNLTSASGERLYPRC